MGVVEERDPDRYRQRHRRSRAAERTAVGCEHENPLAARIGHPHQTVAADL